MHDYDHGGSCGDEPARDGGGQAGIMSFDSDDSGLGGGVLEKTGEYDQQQIPDGG